MKVFQLKRTRNHHVLILCKCYIVKILSGLVWLILCNIQLLFFKCNNKQNVTLTELIKLPQSFHTQGQNNSSSLLCTLYIRGSLGVCDFCLPFHSFLKEHEEYLLKNSPVYVPRSLRTLSPCGLQLAAVRCKDLQFTVLGFLLLFNLSYSKNFHFLGELWDFRLRVK